MKNPVSGNATGLPSRRRAFVALAGTVAAVALPVAVQAAEDSADPIFAMIDKHRVAYAACEACRGEGERAPLTDAADDILWELVNVRPRTLAGLTAFATYLDTYAQGGDDQAAIWALTAVADTLRQIGGAT